MAIGIKNLLIPIFVLGVISIFSIFSESKGKTLNLSLLDERLEFQIAPFDSSTNDIKSNHSDSISVVDSLYLVSDTLNLSPSDSLALID
ncbi:MAG TPA: hypothetical protein ENN33_05955, partial [Ignavibacteria bacterium]|nr:hypothetical protein [Ignavibacteria bacterium]